MDYYKTLGITPTDDDEEIKAAYIKKINKLKNAEFFRQVSAEEYENLRYALEQVLGDKTYIDFLEEDTSKQENRTKQDHTARDLSLIIIYMVVITYFFMKRFFGL